MGGLGDKARLLRSVRRGVTQKDGSSVVWRVNGWGPGNGVVPTVSGSTSARPGPGKTWRGETWAVLKS